MPMNTLYGFLVSDNKPGQPCTSVCIICSKIMTRAARPIPCATCGKTMHLKCSGLRHLNNYTREFIGPCCKDKLVRQSSLNTPDSSSPSPRLSNLYLRETLSHPNPSLSSPDLSETVSTSHPPTDEFRILQSNCNGLTRKIIENTDLMDRKDTKIAAIQETKLTSRNKLTHSSNYTLMKLYIGRSNPTTWRPS